jgi:tryptophan synthase beta chain
MGEHAARFAGGCLGVLHGTRTFILQDPDGQIEPTHSVSAGLDYPAVGPEHSLLRDLKRVSYVSCSDREALEAFQLLSRLEGIIPALESAHAVAYGIKLAPKMGREQILLINLSGRGDKDVEVALKHLGGRSR